MPTPALSVRPSLFSRIHAVLRRSFIRPDAARPVPTRNLHLERLAKAPGPVALHDGNPIALLTSGALRR